MGRLPAAALLTALALTVPSAARGEASAWLARDKALHVGASFLVTVAGYGAGATVFDCAPGRLGVGTALGVAAGLAKELADLAGAGEPDWRDLAADLVGIGLGLLVAWAVDALLTGSAAACRRRPGPALAGGRRRACPLALR